MKKRFYILCTLLVLSIGAPKLYANECSNTCSIDGGPAPVITEYITNMDTLISGIRQIASSAGNNTPESRSGKDIFKIKQRVISGYNSILSFGEYYGSFDYHILLPLTQDVPRQVKRDYNKIAAYSDRLSNMLESYERRNIAGTSMENPCNRLAHCSFSSSTTIREVIASSIQNNQQILLLFTESISGRGDSEVQPNLVAPDFKQQLQIYYTPDTLTSCSACEGGTFANFKETISNISIKNSSYSAGVQSWKNSWALLRGQAPETVTRETEERVLAQYLSEQNISSGQANIVMENLRRYNSGGLSSSNPLENTKEFLKNSLSEQYKTFDEAVLEKFRDTDRVPITDLRTANIELQSTDQIARSISNLYNDQRPYAFSQDTITMQLQSRLIKMHFSLTESINKLSEIIPTANKVCEKQGTGDGICDYSK